MIQAVEAYDFETALDVITHALQDLPLQTDPQTVVGPSDPIWDKLDGVLKSLEDYDTEGVSALAALLEDEQTSSLHQPLDVILKQAESYQFEPAAQSLRELIQIHREDKVNP